MIRTRQLNIILGLLVTAVIASAVIAYYSVRQIDTLVNRLNATSTQIDTLRAIAPIVDEQLFAFMNNTSDASADIVTGLDQGLNQQFGRLEQVGRQVANPIALGQIKAHGLRIVESLRDIQAGNPNAYAALDNEREALEASTDASIGTLRQRNERTLEEIRAFRQRQTALSIIIPLLAVAALLFWAMPALYRMANRIDNLNHSLRAIGKGAMGIRLAPKGNDALTAIEQTVNTMAEQLQVKDSERQHKATYLENEVARHSADLSAANERLRSIDENRKAFIVELAHTLKTPLAVARVNLENASINKESDTTSLVPSLHAIDDVIHKVQDLLHLAQSEDGLIGAEYEELELYELLDGRVVRFRQLENTGSIELKYAGDSPLIVYGQRSELVRLFDAIIENATQHSNKNTPVVIELFDGRRYIEVNISNEGRGIPAEKQERVFERYYSNRPDGTGIGLAMARRIATEHKGEIGVGASAEGATTFTVRLPKCPISLSAKGVP